jgi:hypothetical protein
MSGDMLIETKLGKFNWIEDWAKIPGTPAGRENGRTHGVVSLSNGNIIVSHQATPSILVYNNDGKLHSSWGEFSGAHGLTVCYEKDKEYIWLTDEFSSRVVKMTLEGREVLSLTRPDHPVYGNGKKFIPTWAAQNPKTGEIWVADGYGAYLVHRFSATGDYLMSLDGTEGAGRFNEPHGIQFSRHSESPEIFITDRANHRIVVYNGDGEFIQSSLSAHSPCCFDFHGDHILVPELFTGVKILDYNSLELIAEIGANKQVGPDPNGGWWPPRCPDGWPDLAGTEYIRQGNFNSPHGACFSSNGDIYVVEWIIGGRIIKLEKQ